MPSEGEGKPAASTGLPPDPSPQIAVLRRLLDDLMEAMTKDIPASSRPAPEPSAILETADGPFLYLGTGRDALDLDCLGRLGITRIFNLAPNVIHTGQVFYGEGFQYSEIDAVDTDEFPIREKAFGPAFEFFDNARRDKARVLCHCQAGVSRSATVVIAYVMRERHLGAEAAIRHVSAQRNPRKLIVYPNDGFLEQLLKYEEELQRQVGGNARKAAATCWAPPLPEARPEPSQFSCVLS
eukprot:tig00021352_g20701.t1